jgi:hypothetical protein
MIGRCKIGSHPPAIVQGTGDALTRIGRKLSVALATVLLVCAGAAHSAVQFDSGDSTKATGITDLTIGGKVYDVKFESQKTAAGVYGPSPGTYDFPSNSSASEAVIAVNNALNGAGAQTVGSSGVELYFVGFGFENLGQAESVKVWEGSIVRASSWSRIPDPDILAYNFDERTFATFTAAGGGPPPEPEPEPEPEVPPPDTNTGDYVFKVVNCPASNVTLIPAGSRFTLNDVSITSNKDQAVTLKFDPPNQVLLKLFMKARLTFDANFRGLVESENEQALKLDCSGTADTTLNVTIVGAGSL